VLSVNIVVLGLVSGSCLLCLLAINAVIIVMILRYRTGMLPIRLVKINTAVMLLAFFKANNSTQNRSLLIQKDERDNRFKQKK